MLCLSGYEYVQLEMLSLVSVYQKMCKWSYMDIVSQFP